VAFSARAAHGLSMKRDHSPDDYAVVVKLRANPPKPWRWEIYCAGKRLPVLQSDVCFETRGTAHTAGKAALTQLLEKARPAPAGS
jgi:hypothetical protein